jgi:hypothetical protein
LKYREDMSVKEYYQENKEWLQKIAMSSDFVLKSMALAVIIAATEQEQ